MYAHYKKFGIYIFENCLKYQKNSSFHLILKKIVVHFHLLKFSNCKRKFMSTIYVG
jgi:hypothetical protein